TRVGAQNGATVKINLKNEPKKNDKKDDKKKAEPKKMSGSIELEGANVKWYLSIDRHDLPQEAVDAGKPTYRSLTYDGKEIEFSTGFTDLHTRMYQTILAGESFGLEAARPAIELVHRIRQAKISPIDDGAHWKLHQKS
ncbi:MAG: hypothetical protein AAFQ87_01305, partial [Bacteroidota bacterium]